MCPGQRVEWWWWWLAVKKEKKRQRWIHADRCSSEQLCCFPSLFSYAAVSLLLHHFIAKESIILYCCKSNNIIPCRKVKHWQGQQSSSKRIRAKSRVWYVYKRGVAQRQYQHRETMHNVDSDPSS